MWEMFHFGIIFFVTLNITGMLGQEYCPGFTDSFGKWNTGFYCPPVSQDSPIVYCCGTQENMYCCTGLISSSPTIPTYMNKPSYVEMETEIEISNDYQPTGTTTFPASPLDIGRNSYVAAVIGGLVTVVVVMTLVSCFYCSCCLLYKKRRAQLPGGLYRIPASSTTCGLINSGNGPPTPASSLVTTPLNPSLFTNWTSTSTNPLQGQLLRTNPSRLLLLPQPHPTRVNSAVTPTLINGESFPAAAVISSISSQCTTSSSSSAPATSHVLTLPTPNHDRLVIGNSTSSNCISNGPSRHPTTIPSTISSQLQRHLSLLQQHNPSLLRSICVATSGGNNGGLLHRSNRTHCDTLPTIYTTGSRSHGGGASGTMNSLISSVTSSSTSNNSLPPPYFLEQYRIRNRVRQPRNVSPAVLLPSYNETQRELLASSSAPRRDETCLARSGPRGDSRTTSSTMNDLSAPPRHRTSNSSNNNNHERVGRSRVNNNNNDNYHETSSSISSPATTTTSPPSSSTTSTYTETTTVNLPILNSTPPNPKRIQSNSISKEEPSRNKILNTSVVSVQRTSSDSTTRGERRSSMVLNKASTGLLGEINGGAKKVTTTSSFSPPLNHRHARVVKSHSVGNVTRDRDPCDS